MFFLIFFFLFHPPTHTLLTSFNFSFYIFSLCLLHFLSFLLLLLFCHSSLSSPIHLSPVCECDGPQKRSGQMVSEDFRALLISTGTSLVLLLLSSSSSLFHLVSAGPGVAPSLLKLLWLKQTSGLRDVKSNLNYLTVTLDDGPAETLSPSSSCC